MKTFYRIFVVMIMTFMITQVGYPQTIKMNEIYSRGTTADPDWIEVYNPLSSQIDISGYKIYDNGGQSGSKPKMEFPSGTVLEAKGFFVIVTADGSAADFGLGSGGDKVWLEDASGLLIDSVDIPALGNDTSFARIPDGSDFLTKTSPLTRGVSNVLVKMNEIYSRGTTTDPDWIEIYNSSATDIDVSGYKIYDSGGKAGSKPKMEFPSGTVVLAKGFFVIVTADGSAADFGLGSGGETVWLENATGLLIDTVAFPALGEDTSYARVPDGSGLFEKLSPPTKGLSNEFVIPVELISFSASLSKNAVNLNWATATETNNKGFEIQRKSKSGDFKVIGFAEGAGTTTEKQNYTFVDQFLTESNYQYRLKQIDFNGSYSYSNIVEIELAFIPEESELVQNYPNPFNPVTFISYQIASNSFVTLKVFDVLGNQVAELVNEYQNAGSYNIQFSTNSFKLTSGTYFYELRAGDFVNVKKMLLMK